MYKPLTGNGTVTVRVAKLAEHQRLREGGHHDAQDVTAGARNVTCT